MSSSVYRVGVMRSKRPDYDDLNLLNNLCRMALKDTNLPIRFEYFERGADLSDILTAVHNGTLAMFCEAFVPTKARASVVKFSEIIRSDNLALVTPMIVDGKVDDGHLSFPFGEALVASLQSMVRGFSSWYWGELLLIMSILAMTSLLIQQIDLSGHSLWRWYGHLVMQDTTVTNNPRCHMAIFLILTSIMSMFSFGLYQNVLLTQLVTPSIVAPNIDSLEALVKAVEEKKAKIDLVHPSWAYYDLFYKSELPIFQQFRKYLNGTYDGPMILVTNVNRRTGLSELYARKSCHSNLVVVTEIDPTQNAIPVSPQYPEFLAALDKSLKRNRAFFRFMISNVDEQLQEKFDICRHNYLVGLSRKPGDAIPLEMAYGILLIWLIGMSLAIGCFISERMRDFFQ